MVDPQVKTQTFQPARLQVPVKKNLIFPGLNPDLGQAYRPVKPRMRLSMFLEVSEHRLIRITEVMSESLNCRD